MGVETKFGIYSVSKEYDELGNVTFDYGRPIASVDCHKLGWDIDAIVDSFSDKELDFAIYQDDGDTKFEKSPYGGKYHYITDLKGLRDALVEKNKKERYIYLTLFCNNLKILLKSKYFKPYKEVRDNGTARESFLAVVVFRY